jgi:coiled-coil domain-containing protein 130
MGRYVPPDQEGLTTGNNLAGKHALGARARHLQTKGALVVRFEMPFAIWCTTCKPHETIIGQGVRFNAEKKKVDSYYSTPVYSFRMKHTACGGWIEIRTDPKNTAYVVTEGARKRDTGEDKEEEPGEFKIGLNDRAKEEKDPFAKLEGKVEDKRQSETARMRIQDLQKRQRRDWEDPYEQSRRLRKTFRHERRRLEGVGEANEALKERMSLGIDLLEETDEDRLRASFVDFGPAVSGNGTTLVTKSRIRPMFGDETVLSQKASSTNKSSLDRRKEKGKPKSEVLAAERKALLSNELRGNTRAVVDPFLNEGAKAWQPSQLKARGIRDKKVVGATVEAREKEENLKNEPATQDPARLSTPTALVEYESESE